MNNNQLARFLAKVHVNETTGCWEWTAYVEKAGYARFGKLKGHRVSYLHFVGPIPDGLELDHLCHSRDQTCVGGFACKHRSCVNPVHLEPVTRRVNVQRGMSPTARFMDKTHCTKGHLYEERDWPTGKRRVCRLCINERSSRYYGANKTKHKQFQDRWEANHKEERNAYRRCWRAERRAKGLPVS